MKTTMLGPIKVTTTGDPGSATGSAIAGIPGGFVRLIALAVDYNALCPGSTDVVVTCTLPLPKTLLTLANRNADFPLSQVTELERNLNGEQQDASCTQPQLIGGILIVNVAECDPLTDAVIVTAVVQVA